MIVKHFKASFRLFAVVLMITAGMSVYAQRFAVKTNLVGDLLASPSVAGEVGIAPKWTIDLSGQFNFWKMGGDRRWKHWVVQPEARYWFCDRFSGHFVGAHLLGGQYNVGGVNLPINFLGSNLKKLKDNRYQGWFGGAGIAYGYDWVLNRHWNLEAELGIGWIYTRFDKFRCAGCGKKIDTDHPHNYFGPTKVAVNLVYTF